METSILAALCAGTGEKAATATSDTRRTTTNLNMMGGRKR
eukprot:CAMPEP_0173282022 /NCGR_PEP_ID=MMETSP1143-20121109/6574_1 /TAXON_ID=483371 /ORGANISM="non described non described, Strain CCMP2298" /LENGTH=39 /DNA_ID= /DNA_START= /DNA_END= /DNA_ORIENTATION=